jgi:hypothetical protein
VNLTQIERGIKLASSSHQGDFTEALTSCGGQSRSNLVTRSGDSGVSVKSDKLGRCGSVDLTDDICEDGATPSFEEDGGVLQPRRR